MNGIPEALGTGAAKLVDINPAIGMLVAGMLIIIIWQQRELLKSQQRERDANDRHLKYVEGRASDDRKDRDTFELMADRLDEIHRGRK